MLRLYHATMNLTRHHIHLWLTAQSINTGTFIREVLSQYLDKPPQQIHLNHNPHGKPQLKDRRINLQFNASHSHGLTVCAVSHGLMLGVDVEYLPRRNRLDEIAKRYFHADERKQLQSITDETLRRRLFFELWTRKEAFIKAHGKTIGTLSLDSLPFHVVDNHITPAFSLPRQQHWQFHSQCYGDYLITTAHAGQRWRTQQNCITLFELN